MIAGMFNGFPYLFVSLFILGSAYFASAGRAAHATAWVMLGIHLTSVLVTGAWVMRYSPGLLAERNGPMRNTKSWDKPLALYIGTILPISIWLVAGLDARNGWTGLIPRPLERAAIATVASGAALVTWSIASNRFFSSFVRIQADRGHTVATGGPYRLTRHPGYLGTLLSSLALPVALGSAWALLPAGVMGLILVIRTAKEDSTLRQELDGYEQYATRVRYRLLPGLW